MMVALSTNATIWRVNGNPNIDADFHSLQTAVSDPGVANFDTLYVESFGDNYGDITLTKPLVLIGAGYFLNENDTTQALKDASVINHIEFDPGSEGSVLIGFYLTYCRIDVDGITIKRNRIRNVGSGSNVSAIRIENPGSSATIIAGNYIFVKNTSGSTSANSNGIRCFNSCNLVVKNNYFESIISHSNSARRRSIIIYSTSSLNQAFIYNNVFLGNTVAYYATFYNNVMIEGDVVGDNNTYEYNIGSGTQYPTGNGNQQNVDMSTVFVDHTSGIDNGLLLAPGSPAIAAGMNGTDCGMFGGNTPYVLSGIPPVPSIFEINYTGVGPASVPIQVNLKAKSNK